MFGMILNRAVPLMALLLAVTACSNKYKIEGSSSVRSRDGKTLTLRMLTDGDWVAVDSAEVVHGNFEMQGVVDSACMVGLFMDDEYIMPIVLERGKITVSITYAYTECKAGGTLLNKRLYEFMEKYNNFELQQDDLDRKEARMILDGGDADVVHAQLVKEAEDLEQEKSDYVKTFIKDNYENVLGPSVFLMMCGTLPYPMMTPDIEDIMRTAPMAFKQNPLVEDFLSAAKEKMQLIEEHQRMLDSQAETDRAMAAENAKSGK
ncbi:MAG: DUF4369 domain-containing protein [Prevotellaceae bacterium]|nr:DUF4369 domain-containing protein [Prevotellaceae bacterium]